MVSRFAVSTLLLSLALLGRADPSPSEPGPGEVFNEGAACKIGWTPDTTGKWTTMNIELMTGDNWNMVHLTTVATLDGTKESTFSYTCPGVTLHAPVYFYQFTAQGQNATWATRFTIATADGTTEPAPEHVQPDGQLIDWGTGALADPSTATPAPSYLSSSPSASAGASSAIAGASSAAASVASGAVSAASSVAGAASSAVSSVAASITASRTSSSARSSASASASSNASTAASSSQNSAGLGLGAVASVALRSGVALAAVAGAFSLVL